MKKVIPEKIKTDEGGTENQILLVPSTYLKHAHPYIRNQRNVGK